MNTENQERDYFYSANIYSHSLDFIEFMDGMYTEFNPKVGVKLIKDKILKDISLSFKDKVNIHLISFNRVD